jgi:VanZ family protein
MFAYVTLITGGSFISHTSGYVLPVVTSWSVNMKHLWLEITLPSKLVGRKSSKLTNTLSEYNIIFLTYTLSSHIVTFLVNELSRQAITFLADIIQGTQSHIPGRYYSGYTVTHSWQILFRVHSHTFLADIIQGTQSHSPGRYNSGYTVTQSWQILFRVHSHTFLANIIQGTQSHSPGKYNSEYTVIHSWQI